MEMHEKKLLAEEIYELFEDYLMASLTYSGKIGMTNAVNIRDYIRSEDHDSIINDLIDILDKKLEKTEDK